jgi:hypothetical protein
MARTSPNADGGNAAQQEAQPTDEERIAELSDFIEGWDSAAHSDTENVNLAFHAARLVADTNYYGTRTYLFSREIDGEHFPPALKLLLTREWHGSTFATDDNRILIERCDQPEIVRPRIPGWEDIFLGRNFYEAVEKIASDPEILKTIQFGKRYIDPAVRIVFEPAFFHDWGLEFVATQREIKVRVFGKQGKTEQAVDFLLSYHARQRVLAELVAQLAVLAIRNNDHLEASRLDMDLLMRRLIGEEKVPLDDMEISAPSGMQEAVIEHLIEQGHLEIPDEPDES